MHEEKFSPEQSLTLIRSMISKTRQQMSDNSIYFLVWGWLAFVACVAQFILKHIFLYEKHYLVWSIIIIGIGFSIYQGRRDGKKIKARTYVDDSIRHLWGGMGISFFVLGMVLTKLGWETSIFPFYILLYGLGTFVSGSIIQFKPLVIGGIIAWVLAIASTWANYDYQMLFGAGALLISYIIPAHALRRKFKNSDK